MNNDSVPATPENTFKFGAWWCRISKWSDTNYSVTIERTPGQHNFVAAGLKTREAALEALLRELCQ